MSIFGERETLEPLKKPNHKQRCLVVSVVLAKALREEYLNTTCTRENDINTHAPRTGTERDKNRWVICDSLQPLVQPPIGIVDVRVGSPQYLVPLNQDRKGKNGRVRRYVYWSPFVSRVRGRENDSMIAGLANASMERRKQPEGFVEYSPD